MVTKNPNCTSCRLHKNATNVCVFGRGTGRVVIIGEAPGKQEDLLDTPFVGRAGKLLDEALKRGGLSREEVYITNLVKCRPPDNRTPKPDEILTCSEKYLIPELEEIRPTHILLLGNTALKTFTYVEGGISRNRGKISHELHWCIYKAVVDNDPFKLQLPYFVPTVYATYHPAAALRSISVKEIFWQDVIAFSKLVLNHLANKEVLDPDTQLQKILQL